jgi:hypothetical protein
MIGRPVIKKLSLLTMYLLSAKSADAFWIPDGAKQNSVQNYPWCIT